MEMKRNCGWLDSGECTSKSDRVLGPRARQRENRGKTVERKETNKSGVRTPSGASMTSHCFVNLGQGSKAEARSLIAPSAKQKLFSYCFLYPHVFMATILT
jgi:hypothetical protein